MEIFQERERIFVSTFADFSERSVNFNLCHFNFFRLILKISVRIVSNNWVGAQSERDK